MTDEVYREDRLLVPKVDTQGIVMGDADWLEIHVSLPVGETHTCQSRLRGLH